MTNFCLAESNVTDLQGSSKNKMQNHILVKREEEKNVANLKIERKGRPIALE